MSIVFLFMIELTPLLLVHCRSIHHLDLFQFRKIFFLFYSLHQKNLNQEIRIYTNHDYDHGHLEFVAEVAVGIAAVVVSVVVEIVVGVLVADTVAVAAAVLAVEIVAVFDIVDLQHLVVDIVDIEHFAVDIEVALVDIVHCVAENIKENVNILIELKYDVQILSFTFEITSKYCVFY